MLSLNCDEIIDKSMIYRISSVRLDFENWYKVILCNGLGLYCKDVIFDDEEVILKHLKQQVDLFAKE